MGGGWWWWCFSNASSEDDARVQSGRGKEGWGYVRTHRLIVARTGGYAREKTYKKDPTGGEGRGEEGRKEGRKEVEWGEQGGGGQGWDAVSRLWFRNVGLWAAKRRRNGWGGGGVGWGCQPVTDQAGVTKHNPEQKGGGRGGKRGVRLKIIGYSSSFFAIVCLFVCCCFFCWFFCWLSLE